ncbi:hypothetical protein ACFL6C_06825 [Myxococcota bacterium]
MNKLFVLAVCLTAFAIAACSSTKLSPAEAEAQVKQLMTLYDQNKPKFVLQKQELEQAGDCGRATSLRHAIDKMASKAAMSPEDTEMITLVQMELQQAEKTCLDK